MRDSKTDRQTNRRGDRDKRKKKSIDRETKRMKVGKGRKIIKIKY
jgi:hypothetical protein